MLRPRKSISASLLIAALSGALPYRATLAEPPTAKQPVPAETTIPSARQLNEICDLRKLPVPKEGFVHGSTEAELVIVSSSDFKQTAQFYRQALATLGYQPSTEQDPEWNTDEFATTPFTKDGHTVLLHLRAVGEGETWIALHRCGKFDLRRLPQSSDATVEYATPTTLKYLSKNDVKTECALLKRELEKAGWQEFQDSMGISVQWQDTLYHFTLRNRGYLLSVRVGERFGKRMATQSNELEPNETKSEKLESSETDSNAKKPAESEPIENESNKSDAAATGETATGSFEFAPIPLGDDIKPGPAEVRYTLRTLPRELPAPAAAQDIQIAPDFSNLRCRVPQSIDAVEKYYRQAMPTVGYKPLKHDPPGPDYRRLRFEAEDQGVVVVELFDRPDFKDLIVAVQYYSPDERDEVPPPMIEGDEGLEGDQ